MVAIALMITIISAQQLVKALTSLEQIEQWRKQVEFNQPDPLERILLRPLVRLSAIK